MAGDNFADLMNEAIDGAEVELESGATLPESGAEASGEPESLEQSILNAIEEVGGDPEAPAKDDIKRRDMSASEAASILAKSKGSRRKVIENPGKQPATPKPAPAAGAPATPAGQQPAPAAAAGLEPPARFSPEEKEWYRAQPPAIQRSVTDIVRGLEQQARQSASTINSLESRYKGLEEAERLYMPAVHEANPKMTFQGAVTEMFRTQAKLANPQTRVAECARILRSVGVSAQQVHEVLSGRSSQPAAQQPAQQNVLTEPQVREIWRQEQENLTRQQHFNRTVGELQALKAERFQDGSLAWPELHDDAQIEALKPLADYVLRTTPGISVVEATKQAILRTRPPGSQNPGTPATADPRASRPNELAQVRRAAVSVRPRANGAIPRTTGSVLGEKMEDSILRSIAELEQR